MEKIIAITLLMLPVISSSCQNSVKPSARNSEVRLAKENEPGKKFTLDITVLDIDSRQPVKDAEVFAYHTNHKGDYEHDAKGVARIHGTAFSDRKGGIRFHTIYPRGYNNSNTGEHIHFTVKADGYKKENTELLFAEYYEKRYDYNKPVPQKVYLQSLDEKNNELHGKTLIYIKKS
jgi:protocatechuate 3,4-dioxygenase beta subunit